MKVTQWFPLSKNPARKGVYQIQLQTGFGKPIVSRARFNGKKWFNADNGYCVSHECGDMWRGLAEKPAEQGK